MLNDLAVGAGSDDNAGLPARHDCPNPPDCPHYDTCVANCANHSCRWCDVNRNAPRTPSHRPVRLGVLAAVLGLAACGGTETIAAQPHTPGTPRPAGVVNGELVWSGAMHPSCVVNWSSTDPARNGTYGVKCGRLDWAPDDRTVQMMTWCPDGSMRFGSVRGGNDQTSIANECASGWPTFFRVVVS